MSELRQDPTTNEWVIIAGERAGRPHDFAKGRAVRSAPVFVDDCPFCPGNERLTPPEVAVYRDEPGASNWKIRVVPNKFGAVVPQGSIDARLVEGHFAAMQGFGFHEVVVESPRHNQTLSRMELSDAEAVMGAYRDRYRALRNMTNVKLIIILKNHGTSAGTSLEHPHSQVVTTPVVSAQVRQKRNIAKQHYDKTSRCLYCDINRWELESGSRLVYHDYSFVVFHPYAARYPFETWISPLKHRACFGDIDPQEISGLAKVLPETLGKIDRALGEPDFNYIVHTAPVEDEGSESLHWYVQIVPRISTTGGFEIGSGIYINMSSPEETAKLLRKA